MCQHACFRHIIRQQQFNTDRHIIQSARRIQTRPGSAKPKVTRHQCGSLPFGDLQQRGDPAQQRPARMRFSPDAQGYGCSDQAAPRLPLCPVRPGQAVQPCSARQYSVVRTSRPPAVMPQRGLSDKGYADTGEGFGEIRSLPVQVNNRFRRRQNLSGRWWSVTITRIRQHERQPRRHGEEIPLSTVIISAPPFAAGLLCHLCAEPVAVLKTVGDKKIQPAGIPSGAVCGTDSAVLVAPSASKSPTITIR